MDCRDLDCFSGEHLVTHDLSYDSTNDSFQEDKTTSAEEFSIRDKSALSSGSQLDEEHALV